MTISKRPPRVVRTLGREGTIIAGLSFTALCYLILWAAPQVHPQGPDEV